jgi:zinc protease
MKKIRNTFLGLLSLLVVPVFSYAGSVVPSVFHTKNGMPVYFVQRKNLPMVDMAVVYAAGSVRDSNQYGLANMTEELMGHATQKYSEKEISNTMAETGAVLNSQLTRDMSVWTLRSLTDHKKLAKAVTVLHSILVQPTFPKKILTRLQDQVRVQILQQEQDPMALAKNSFFSTMFKGNGYAHSPLGSKKSLAELKPSDCKAFYQAYYTAKNAFLVLVGDLSNQQARKLANQLSRGMLVGQPATAIAKIQPSKKETVFVPLRKAQTTLVMGQLGFQPNSQGMYARLVGNDIFGGAGLNSILSDEVREKRGLAYFAYSQLVKLQGGGPFVMLTQSRAHNAGKAYQTMLHSYQNFLKNGVTSSQLDASKRSLVGRSQLSNVSNQAILSNLVRLVFYKLPLNYFQTFPQKVKAVTQKGVIDSFSKLKNKSLVAVMVGAKDAFPQEK